ANRSGRPSATTWESVLIDLDGRIDGVLCGPPTRIGLESTVVDTTTDEAIILRHGAITQEMIDQELISQGWSSARPSPPNGSTGVVATSNPPGLERRSPGTRHRHYQPKAQVVLFDSIDRLGQLPASVAILGIAPMSDISRIESELAKRYPASKRCICGSLDLYAGRLFEFFRECDSQGVQAVYCQRVERFGLGRAIMDRLDRAAG
ncbi:MAG: Sua5/YciO/YrdC/YwlC family protein, partial [Planctomycetota bacterium]|nr:Sua5/YciO/YrdC/YwlC family protein [Planctomycetota bacterium]